MIDIESFIFRNQPVVNIWLNSSVHIYADAKKFDNSITGNLETCIIIWFSQIFHLNNKYMGSLGSSNDIPGAVLGRVPWVPTNLWISIFSASEPVDL